MTSGDEQDQERELGRVFFGQERGEGMRLLRYQLRLDTLPSQQTAGRHLVDIPCDVYQAEVSPLQPPKPVHLQLLPPSTRTFPVRACMLLHRRLVYSS